MKKEGLLVEPEFDNIEKYLQSGERTKVTDEIRRFCEMVDGQTEEILVRNLLVCMNKYTVKLRDSRDPRKFKRTASEILESGERTGCCDSSTLFTAMARAKGIPTMQVITLDKNGAEEFEKGERKGGSGHYFVACYLENTLGEAEWKLIDSNREVKDPRDAEIIKLDKENRNINGKFYAFAYVRDYSDIKLGELKIDSTDSMNRIQMETYRRCDKNDFIKKEKKEDMER